MHYRRLFLLNAVQYRPAHGTDFVIPTSCQCRDCLAEAILPSPDDIRFALDGPAASGRGVSSFGINGPVDAPAPVEALFDEDGEETDRLYEARALVAHAADDVWLSVEVDEADPWADLVEVSVQ